MAVTTYGVNDALTVKLWERTLAEEALKATPIAPLIGTSEDSIIQKKDELSSTAGDRVTVGLVMQLSGEGRTENQSIEGNEESLTTYSDNLLINELNHAVRVRGANTIDNQRVLFDTRSIGRRRLKDWYAKRLSMGFFHHVGGYVGASYSHSGFTFDRTKAVFNLSNTITAASSGRIIWAAAGSGESNTADEGIESDDVFDLRYVDYAKEVAQTATPPIRPVMINGEATYVMYLHPYQVTDLRTSTDTGQWQDIQKAAMMGGKVSGNPIFTGALGMYNNVVLRESWDVCQGYNSSTLATISTVRRAVLLGAQAAIYGTGQSFGTAGYKWVEEEFDYKRELGISVQSLMGLKKSVFNSTDFGTVVVSTYAAAHT